MRTPDMFLSKQEREEKKRRLNESLLPPKPEPEPEPEPEPCLSLSANPILRFALSTRLRCLRSLHSDGLIVYACIILCSDRSKPSTRTKQQWRGLDFPIHPPALLYPSEPAFASSPSLSLAPSVALPQISFSGSYFSGVSPLRLDPKAQSDELEASEPSESIESVITELSVRVMQ